MLPELALFCLSIFTFLYTLKKIKYSYWSSRGVEGQKPSFPFGIMKEIFFEKKSSVDVFTNMYNDFKSRGLKYGSFYMFLNPWLLVFDSEILKPILTADYDHFHSRGIYYNEDEPLTRHIVNVDGDRWKSLRTRLSPIFSPNKLKGMVDLVCSLADNFCNVLSKYAESGQDFDIKYIVGAYTTDVIGNCAFGIDCNSLKDPNTPFYVICKNALIFHISRTIKFFLSRDYPSLFAKLKLKLIDKDINDFFMGVTKDVVDHRKKTGETRNDMLQVMIDQMDATGQSKLSLTEIAAHTFIFFLAGYDTSSTFLNYILYELADKQDIQDKLREEVTRVAENHGGLSYEAVRDMPYLLMVLEEVLRMYPPLERFQRMCKKKYTVPGTDLTIEEGVRLMVPVFAIHRDPKNYPDPEQFDPERFSKENKQNRDPLTYIPFGAGPRMCIGSKFALLNARLLVAKIVMKYKFFVSPKTQLPFEYDTTNVSLQVKGKIWLKVKKL